MAMECQNATLGGKSERANWKCTYYLSLHHQSPLMLKKSLFLSTQQTQWCWTRFCILDHVGECHSPGGHLGRKFGMFCSRASRHFVGLPSGCRNLYYYKYTAISNMNWYRIEPFFLSLDQWQLFVLGRCLENHQVRCFGGSRLPVSLRIRRWVSSESCLLKM